MASSQYACVRLCFVSFLYCMNGFFCLSFFLAVILAVIMLSIIINRYEQAMTYVVSHFAMYIGRNVSMKLTKFYFPKSAKFLILLHLMIAFYLASCLYFAIVFQHNLIYVPFNRFTIFFVITFQYCHITLNFCFRTIPWCFYQMKIRFELDNLMYLCLMIMMILSVFCYHTLTSFQQCDTCKLNLCLQKWYGLYITLLFLLVVSGTVFTSVKIILAYFCLVTLEFNLLLTLNDNCRLDGDKKLPLCPFNAYTLFSLFILVLAVYLIFYIPLSCMLSECLDYGCSFTAYIYTLCMYNLLHYK